MARPITLLFIVVLAVAALGPGVERPARTGDEVPKERLARLARGVNLSHLSWTHAGSVEQERAKTLAPVDVAVMRGIGLTHVRLAFHPPALWDERKHALKAEGLERLKRAAGLVLAGGLAVVLDAHTGMEMGWTMPEENTKRAEELERFWTALATSFSATDPELVFFEVLNEPHGTTDNGELWGAAQERVVAAIRAAAPRHTIIATGDDWGSIDGLVRLKPLADKNIVYSFHLYEPHTFSHQGTFWGVPAWKHIRGLEYPARAENAALVAAGIPPTDEDTKKAADDVRQYVKDGWNAAKVAARVGEAAAWGKKHGVPIYCGEFGAYRVHAPAGSRVAWIQDARRALDDIGAGWAMWEYRGDFGLLEGTPDSRKTDEGVVRALGLRR